MPKLSKRRVIKILIARKAAQMHAEMAWQAEQEASQCWGCIYYFGEFGIHCQPHPADPPDYCRDRALTIE